MIKKIGVVGLGTMGLSIIKHLASLEEFNLIGYSRNSVKDDKKFMLTHKLDDLHDCDLVIEAIEENFKTKSDVFCKIASIVSKKCILATNTSSLSVQEMSSIVGVCERFVGLHFFNPVKSLKLVEVVFLKNTL